MAGPILRSGPSGRPPSAAAMSSLGVASLHGRPAPVLGRVSMDQVLVDVTEAPETAMGDEAVLLGAGGGDSFAQAAEKIGTISYELLCAVARRVPRVYLRGGEAVAVDDYLADVNYSNPQKY